MSLYSTPLDDLRNEIQALDRQLIELLGKRLNLVSQVGQYKKSASLEISNPFVELEKIKGATKILGVSYSKYIPSFMEGLFTSSKLLQQDIMDGTFSGDFSENTSFLGNR